MNGKILIIEDEAAISELLTLHLKDLNKEVDTAFDGQQGLEKALENKYDLIVLDLMLPKLDGMEVCKSLRKKEVNTPVLMLTAKSEEFDKVLGLEIGADDYMTKPFSVREFTARVKALLRRTSYVQDPTQEKQVRQGALIIDPDKRKVWIQEKKIELTAKEFDLLYLLAKTPGKSYTRSSLLSAVWGYDFSGYEHTVNSHINRLRAKIEQDPDHPQYIKTVWGVGYAFNDEI